jgi:hypothetical protein
MSLRPQRDSEIDVEDTELASTPTAPRLGKPLATRNRVLTGSATLRFRSSLFGMPVTL